MPRATIASRSSSSISSASCSAAISAARSARKPGVATFEGRFRVGGLRADARARHLLFGDAVAGDLQRLDAPFAVVLLVRLEAVEAVGPQQRPLDQGARDALARRQRPRERHRPQLLGPGRRGRRRHPGALGVELVALAQAGDQHATLAAARRVLVRHRHLAQSGARLTELDQLLQGGVGQRLALEQPDHAGVGGGLLRGAAACGHVHLGHEAGMVDAAGIASCGG
jgi:hypothetical protein